MRLRSASVITWAASQAGIGFQEHMAIDSDYVTPAALLPIAQCAYSEKKKKKREENNREIHKLEENETESYLINLLIREGERVLLFKTHKSPELYVCMKSSGMELWLLPKQLLKSSVACRHH